VDAEQAPNPDSRIRLSSSRDALGMPKALIDWRVGEIECHSIQTFARLFSEAWQRAGLGGIAVAGPPNFGLEDRLTAARDIYHQMGTVRMSTSPRHGVVTPMLRCHDLDNLYLVGGGVFPAGGIANPTLTILALALRLADELKARVRAR